MSKKIADVTTKLVSLLEPLDSGERAKAIDAALVILGETLRSRHAGENDNDQKGDKKEAQQDGFPAHTKLRTWMTQNSVTKDQLAQLFHLDNGKVNVIASTVTGSKGGEKS